MRSDVRKSGISLVGELPWGSHFCQFYQTNRELLDILVPFFRAGLENHEFCLWVTPDDAEGVLAGAAFTESVDKGQMEIIPYSRWCALEKETVSPLASMVGKALSAGFDGLRLVCHSSPALSHKELRCGIDDIGKRRVIALFAYYRDEFDAVGLMEVVKGHPFALIRNHGAWEVIESSEARILREELKKSEELYRSLFDNMFNGFAYCRMLYDGDRAADFIFLAVNNAFEALTGLQDVVGRKASAVIPGLWELDPVLLDTYGRVARTGHAEKFEAYVNAMDMWFSISAYSPKQDHFVAVFEVITERKKVEADLQKAYDELEQRIEERTRALRLANVYNRSLIEASLDPLVTIGRDGKITDVNAATEAATGCSRTELIGTDFSDYFTEPEKARAGYQQAFAEGSVHNYSLDLRHPDGHITPVLYNATVYQDVDGEVTGVFAAARDITAQKQAEKALLELNETLERRVSERTAELEAANALLRDSRRAALNMMEDAIDASRRAVESSSRVNLLAETASELLASDSPQQVVDGLCQKVMSFLDCHVFFNFLVDKNDGRLRLNACAGISGEERQKVEWLNYGAAVCGCAARDACRIVAEDIPNTPDPRTDLVKSYGIQAYACHPLLVQGEVLGTLSFGTRTRTRFNDDDLALMKAVADQVAIAMERKRAEIELRRAHDELEMRVRERTEELAATVETLLGEIKERELAEGTLYRLNRLYAVLCETDQTIVRAADRDSLFHDFCRIAVDHGGFLLAWVGVVDKERGPVRIAAASGVTGYLDEIRISSAKEPNGEGPTGISIREGTYYICNDFQNDPCTRPWHEQGRAYGICASASIALKENGRVIGALTLYSREKNFFDQQYLGLLVQMAADITFALDNFSRENQRREAEQALQAETLERLRVVEALREKEQMLIQQSRQAAMGEMISNIAHQWRQPLNILGLTVQQLKLLYDFGEFNGEILENSVNKSMDLVQHMSKTIDDFRNFFKPDKEKVEFPVAETIGNTLSLLAGSLQQPMIGIEIVTKDNPVIYGYRNEYEQVLLNLLINARDALLEREIAVPGITITICRENDRAVVLVADNAGGIPEEIMGKIFDPYFTTKGPQQGTGLGLFMSKSIVEKNMGGKLTVRNNTEGAEFRIEV
ncbi:GAF domain-containing protein [Geobacter sp. OR-1]|uniref:GAF domain-containing protein n=1 Tax=Geobacter sp. OR-1 TaxID=1266765 RepID=UPI000A4C2156|nr:GAF domain-containing protein [Geobacter sp. OR-1]